MYRVTREGEPQRLASCELSNHWLLWHATRASNLLGILASGLEVQPLAQHWNGDPMAKVDTHSALPSRPPYNAESVIGLASKSRAWRNVTRI